MAIKGGKTDRLKAAEWIEQMKIQLRPHYAEHIVDAMVTDQIDSHRDSRNLAMPYKPYVKLAENAKKAGASAEAKAKYRELIATYTKQASHEGYNQGREQDMEEGNLYRIIRGEVTGTTRWNWK
jgi:flagellar biosynthesis/type III secretory pathway protein FliH